MRIISGKHQRKKINPPKDLPVRPTTDFAKEALFNILGNRFSNYTSLNILDLYTGTGNISFEFASRDAKTVTSVDSNNKCIQFVKSISEELSFPIQTITMEVEKFASKKNLSYDIVFADPPYDITDEALLKLSELVYENLLVEGGLLILEHSKHALRNIELPNEIDKRKYGGTLFRFIEKNKNAGL